MQVSTVNWQISKIDFIAVFVIDDFSSCLLYFKKNGIKRPMNLQNRVIFKRQRKSSSDGIEKNERTSEEKMIENIAPMWILIELIIDIIFSLLSF